ncbi:unnamed protein product [Cladocopium goreaui]|uniref:Cupin-like domain-containing protein n=1 Tax=Cladocopium goreaui TaxID=2562237 RepID=A0A9P1DCV5_9DINO|nr:unnamed protein product [Cladocopium goreaui]
MTRVLRQSADLLIEFAAPLEPLEHWLRLAGNATVRVSFPYASQAVPSLNRIIKTETLAAQEALADRTSWTLLRPGSWHMRFVDAVAWAQRHPSQEIYMNQAMVADLGSEALNQLKLNMTKSNGLTLVSPSLWMSSGVVTTGYHVDGPENLLVQLTGTKEISLLKPSEESKLQYQEVVDAEPHVDDVFADGPAALGDLKHLERRSRGHSVLDVAAAPSAVPEDFLQMYQKAEGMSCTIHPRDVLQLDSNEKQ